MHIWPLYFTIFRDRRSRSQKPSEKRNIRGEGEGGGGHKNTLKGQAHGSERPGKPEVQTFVRFEGEGV